VVALARNIRYFVRDFFDDGEVTIDGVKLLTDRNLIGNDARALILSNQYEKPERDLVRIALKPGDRVLEFGGCLGLLSLLCAKLVGEKNVLCYEPSPSACCIITRNYALNGIFPELRQKALTVDGGPIGFFQADNFFSSSMYVRNLAGSQVSVQSDRFRDVVENWRPTSLVIDVEGAECDLIPSSDLDGVTKIVLETHAKIVGSEKTEKLLSYLTAVGFRLEATRHGRGYFRR
jgi:FkbM family methyltransferase